MGCQQMDHPGPKWTVNRWTWWVQNGMSVDGPDGSEMGCKKLDLMGENRVVN